MTRPLGYPCANSIPTLLRLACLVPGQRVLDIATGSGIAAEAALNMVGPSGYVTAADIEPLMLDEARKRLGSYPNVAFVVEDGQALTFPNASFDAVNVQHGSAHFPRPSTGAIGFLSRTP